MASEPYWTQERCIFNIISFNFWSTSSAVQLNRKEFCDISNPEVATPPAFDAFPGENNNFDFWNTRIASGVVGILAPSVTQIQPFVTSKLASSSLSSFCVAQGKATSQGTPQGRLPEMYFAFGNWFM